MKRIVFGNPHTSHWRLVVEGASKREHVVVVSGELHSEFFIAQTPMCIDPTELEAFQTQLEQLDSSLKGSATLRNANLQSEIEWSLTALPLGHIDSTGYFRINDNELRFKFRTDQTQLRPLLEWVKSALFSYESSDDA
jgi:hypothetical protein